MTTVKARLCVAGQCRVPSLFVGGGGWSRVPIPAAFAVIEHPTAGPGLFDTGYAPRFFAATQRLPWWLYRLATPVEVTDADSAVAQLANIGIRAQDVRWVILSHLDPDHVGGLRDFPRADVFVSAGVAASTAGISAFRARLLPGMLPEDDSFRTIIEGPPLEPFRWSCDLFGDGAVVVVPLPGHADGQVGALIRVAPDARWLLCADAVWDVAGLQHDPLVHRGLAHDPVAQADTIQRIRSFLAVHPDVRLVPSHCPATAAALAGWRGQ